MSPLYVRGCRLSPCRFSACGVFLALFSSVMLCCGKAQYTGVPRHTVDGQVCVSVFNSVVAGWRGSCPSGAGLLGESVCPSLAGSLEHPREQRAALGRGLTASLLLPCGPGLPQGDSPDLWGIELLPRSQRKGSGTGRALAAPCSSRTEGRVTQGSGSHSAEPHLLLISSLPFSWGRIFLYPVVCRVPDPGKVAVPCGVTLAEIAAQWPFHGVHPWEQCQSLGSVVGCRLPYFSCLACQSQRGC